MAKKNQEIAVRPSEEALAALKNSYPMDLGFTRTLLPRISFASQDVTEGKGKAMKVIAEAGTFFTEVQTDEKDEEGKNVWEKNEIGGAMQGIILFQRKQLKFFDGEKYTSSPVYDTDDEVLPLFKDKKEVDRGTPKELKARPQYQGKSAAGKDISKLEDNRLLYVLYEGKVHQLSLRGTSMYAFREYARNVLPPAVLTEFKSEPQEKGSIAWNQMTFEKIRDLDANEIADVQSRVDEIRNSIAEEKAYFASLNKDAKKSDDELDTMVADAAKQLE